MTRRRGLSYARVGALVVAIAIALFPFWWMLVTSFKQPVDIFDGVSLVPQHPTGNNYSRLFGAYHMGSFLLNSLIVVTVATFAQPRARHAGRLRAGPVSSALRAGPGGAGRRLARARAAADPARDPVLPDARPVRAC